jgi:hypothetical protein
VPLIPFWKRREFLKVGAATTAAVTAGRAVGASVGASASPAPRFRTSLCDLLRRSATCARSRTTRSA